MKKTQILAIGSLLLLLAGASAISQEASVDRATVPLSDPSQPAVVKASAFRGTITVTGYSGENVIVEAKVRTAVLSEQEEEQDQEKNEKAKGMRLIRSAATGLTITEEDNVVGIRVQAMSQAVDLDIQVPFNTSLKLTAMAGGQIFVEKVKGDHEIQNNAGPVTLTDISGSVVAASMAGALTVTFDTITPDKPMSFTSMAGDVDVTFPATLKADLKMKSMMGDIYSDYEVAIKPMSQKVEKETKEDTGKYRVSFDKTIYGTVNGGGVEYSFSTMQGNIYIRKK
ncbi:MAG: DUF4097 family beta strand repeat protein [Candidatus Aminicenantes bacterium]|nr:DUF4097 family beta strand repeat protein [Candidatus Aminicenantes bacterium]